MKGEGLNMEMTNVKLINADNTLGGLAQQKVNGTLAFKLYRLKQQLEQLVTPVRQTLEDIGYEDQQAPEFQEVLQITQEFEPVEKLQSSELENLDLSLTQIAFIADFIDSQEE